MTSTRTTRAAPTTARTAAVLLRSLGVAAVTVLASAVVLTIIWQVVASGAANGFVARTPLDVWRYLTIDTAQGTASAHRATIVALLGVTLGHAAIGFAVGVGGSVLFALAFVLARPLEFMFLPIAMLARTVPLLAMAPLVQLLFGNGLLTASVIGGIVVFFPVLANVSLGLRSCSPETVDMIRAYGGSRFTVLAAVAVPTTVPYFLAALRIAVPGAVTAAMLYEWLFTFEGLGAAITMAKTLSQYDLIWAIVVLVTLVAITLYAVATLLEQLVLERWAGSPP
ncbi:ABC transporter permease subunit [Pseudonocardia kujensis]|uniref:ABC transporter permease n=1 Tax=Pseudonocardia kujensis TaxID=1128675 RepID=UPI001E63D9A6|nr:ABC transporter permease subunit [Pseudonocardia kujensis]MCE0765041.1 ABC transporter permease subunit [Pseudonocardia kujensis]